MTNEEFDKTVDKIIKVAFPNGESDLEKVLWRMASGCRQEAFYILKLICAHYNIYLTDELFECVMGELNGGIDVEWDTWDWPEIPEADRRMTHARNSKIKELEDIDNKLGNGSIV